MINEQIITTFLTKFKTILFLFNVLQANPDMVTNKNKIKCQKIKINFAHLSVLGLFSHVETNRQR